MGPDNIAEISNRPAVFYLAEAIAFTAYSGHYELGVKAAALLIVGQKNPDGAFRIATSRLRDSAIPDSETYIPVVAHLFPGKAVLTFLDVVAHEPATKTVYAIGRYLRNMDSLSAILGWLDDPEPERRVAACRVCGFQTPTSELEARVRALVDDPENRIAEAAMDAAELLRKSRITNELVDAFVAEGDKDFQWCLLDGLVEVGDLGGSGLPPPWYVTIQDHLSPVMHKYVSEQLEKRSKKEKDDLDRGDQRRKY
jgi:hypothetical protein